MIDLARFGVSPRTERAWRLAKAAQTNDRASFDALGSWPGEWEAVRAHFCEEQASGCRPLRYGYWERSAWSESKSIYPEQGRR